ncbi:MAG: terminase TerL endonuclease subunit, partial [Methylophilaceae bacterium]
SIEYDWVAAYLRDKLDDMEITVDNIQFDRWRISIFQKACEEVAAFQGVVWNPVGQGYRDISPRLESFEVKLLEGKIRHGAHPLLNMAAANAIAVTDPAGSKKIDKSKSTQRIDPLVAAVMALHAVCDGKEQSLPEDLSFLIA